MARPVATHRAFVGATDRAVVGWDVAVYLAWGGLDFWRLSSKTSGQDEPD